MRTLPLLALASYGCSMATIEGQVVDPWGSPVPGVRVSARGPEAAHCSGMSAEDGRFAIDCAPNGEFKLDLHAEGWSKAKGERALLESNRYDLGTFVLVRLPPGPGLWLDVGGEYVAPARHVLDRGMEEHKNEVKRAFCLRPDQAPPMELPGGDLRLVDMGHPGWRVYKLDPEGCAYRDERNERLQWRETWREKPDLKVDTLQDGQRVAQGQLAPGDWFIADWRDFFVAIDESTGRHTYGGTYLRVP